MAKPGFTVAELDFAMAKLSFAVAELSHKEKLQACESGSLTTQQAVPTKTTKWLYENPSKGLYNHYPLLSAELAKTA